MAPGIALEADCVRLVQAAVARPILKRELVGIDSVDAQPKR